MREGKRLLTFSGLYCGLFSVTGGSMAAAARKTASQIALEAMLGAWRHAASARFRGGLTAALGGALALALASWRASDPSLDAAAAGAPGNLLGAAGADIADLFMQTLGLASWLVAA